MKKQQIFFVGFLFIIIISIFLWVLVPLKKCGGTKEGMVTADTDIILQSILDDKNSTLAQKLSSIKAIVDMMEQQTDQIEYISILNDSSVSDNDKITHITDILNKEKADNKIADKITDAISSTTTGDKSGAQ